MWDDGVLCHMLISTISKIPDFVKSKMLSMARHIPMAEMLDVVVVGRGEYVP